MTTQLKSCHICSTVLTKGVKIGDKAAGDSYAICKRHIIPRWYPGNTQYHPIIDAVLTARGRQTNHARLN